MTLPRVLALAAFASFATLASAAVAQNHDTGPIPPEWVAPDAPVPSNAGPSSVPQPVAPLVPVAAKPPPLRTEPYSKPMMIGGGVAAGLGAWLLLFGGLGGWDDDDHTSDDDDTRTTASVVLGSVFVLGGTPFLVIGAQSVPVEEGQARRGLAPSRTPVVRLSATSAAASWAF